VSQHESVRLFLRDIVKSLRDDIQFSYSRQSDFNSTKDKNNVCVHLDPLSGTPQIVDTSIHTNYSVAMLFYKQGQKDDTEEQFVPILDDTADVLEKFLRKLNRYGEDESGEINTDVIQVQSIRQEPAIKVLADVFTGWILTFNLIVPDTFDYCTIYDS
jgi:hypothetical protein